MPTGDPEDPDGGKVANGSAENDVCGGCAVQLASTRFMKRARAARRRSSVDIDWIHWIPSSRRTRISWLANHSRTALLSRYAIDSSRAAVKSRTFAGVYCKRC